MCSIQSQTRSRRDVDKAVWHFRRAADAGSASALVQLGLCFRDGVGVTQSKKKAVELFQTAAEMDFDNAKNYFGALYAARRGFRKV